MNFDREGSGRIAVGVVFILLGVVWLLGILGLIDTAFFHAIAPFWPVGIIIIGVAIILRWGGVAWLFAVLTIFLAIYYAAGHIAERGVERSIDKDIAAAEGVEAVDLKLAYGAGTLNLAEGDSDFLSARIKTADMKDPVLTSDTKGKRMEIAMERGNGAWGTDQWDLGLSPDIGYTLDIDYGAADARLDLSGLMVTDLDIETGATSTELIFASYPTKAKISAGASSISLRIPKDYGASVTVESGLSSVELPGFTKEGRTYYSPGFDRGKDSIEVVVEAGASSIESRLI